MTYLPLPDRTAYSIRANVISVEILITPKIQPRHKWARRWNLSKLVVCEFYAEASGCRSDQMYWNRMEYCGIMWFRSMHVPCP
jgi:hypothetical protein